MIRASSVISFVILLLAGVAAVQAQSTRPDSKSVMAAPATVLHESIQELDREVQQRLEEAARQASRDGAGVDFALDRLGEIAGVVTDAATGEAVAGAWVQVHDHESGSFVGGGTTDSTGAYSIAGLPAGDYAAFTDAAGYRDEVFDDVPCNGECDLTAATPIAVALGTTAVADFALDRPAAGADAIFRDGFESGDLRTWSGAAGGS